ncbi:hypothetical protein [Streptosporangium sp. NPDC087985]|uniref:hypothetical protein n=1 Tax=Streptosporangium sp. NPDC087985 TaxID=3366196 RepID=UPI0037FEF011
MFVNPAILIGLALDGKAVRGAAGPDGRCVHLLSAMLHTARATLAMRAVDRKTNEITQAVPLLSNLDLDHLDGTVVLTADALHSQRKLAAFAIGALHLVGFPNIAAGQRWSHSDYANPLSILDLKM